MKHIKHIFFDLDHTLWDFEKNSREAILHLFMEDRLKEACNAEFDTFLPVYETINHTLWQQYGLQQTTKEELRYQRFYKTFLHFNYDNVDLARRWADDYLTISPYKTHLIEGAIDVLTYLQEKNYILHIITNGFKEVQHIKLEHSKLRNYFRQVIISEDHGVNKPDVRIFELARDLSQAQQEECIMIGDNYDADIMGALNANWKAIYLSSVPQQNTNLNFYQISKLTELKHLL